MADQQHGHQHPEVEQRVKALEERVKKLEKELHDIQHKVETHDHPHSH
ncbi:MAG: hypothetical protein ACLQLC_10410 [Candidatus Sulfotelmatobacter sp.]